MSNSDFLVTKTKIVVPRRRKQLLSRRHLLDQFQEMLSFKCINIAAPAGYGKTSLLIDAAHHLDMPVCWFAIDPLDNEPSRFFSHFLATIAQAFSQFESGLPGLLPPQSETLASTVTPVVNTIYDHIQEHFLLVLDDFHLITNPEIISFVDQFLLLVDENCHMVITSRELVTLPSVLLLAGRADMGGIGAAELAFTSNEIQALVEQNYNTRLSDAAAAELVGATGGWITGLLLSAQTVWQNVVNRMQLAQHSGVSVYDYLTGQVFNQQPESVQDFLLKTSLLEAFNADLCQAVFGPPNYPDGYSWSALMQLVMQNHLFVVQLNNQGLWLRYHHLFQEFLQNKIFTEDPARATEILQKLAKVYACQGEWEKAYHLHQRLGTASTATQLVEQAGDALIAAGRFKLLGNWIDALEPDILQRQPWLLAQRGYVAAMLGNVQHGKLLLDRAIAALEQTDDNIELAKTLVWRAGINRLLGNPQSALDDVEKSLHLTGNAADSMELKAMALRAKGQFLHADRRVNQSITAFEQALKIYKSLGNLEEPARIYLETGVSYMSAGRYEKARRYYGIAEKHFQSTDNRVRLADLYNNWGVLHHLTGDCLMAIATLEKALTLARHSGYTRIEAYSLCGIGDIFTDLEAFDAADSAYSLALQPAIQADDQFLRLYLELVKARQARLKENFSQAETLLAYASQLGPKTEGSYEAGLLAQEAGLLALAQEQYGAAITHLQTAITCLPGDGLRLERARTALHLAAAHYAAKEHLAAKKQVVAALDDVAPLENVFQLAVTARPFLHLLKRASKAAGPDTQPQFDRLFLQVDAFAGSLPALRRDIRRQSLAVQFVAPRLVVRTLGPTEVLQNDVPVATEDWLSQRRAREVFFFLLANPEGYSREAIGLELWPESSQNELKTQFKNTIYRLRRALGKEIIMYDTDLDRYFFNRQLDYEYDVEQFTKHLAEARAAPSMAAEVEALNAAISLYRGPYLPDIEQTWVLPKRQHLSHLYVQANLQVARYHLESDHPNAALPPCWNILQEDPCHETTHRMVMTIHAKTGNRAAVVRQFEQCRKALNDEVGAPVSPQTLQLYQQLIR